jgi:hypothetical protein
MRQHVTSDQIARLRTGALPLEDVEAIARHLPACPECAEALEEEAGLAERIAVVRGQLSDDDSLHATYEELEALVDGTLDEARVHDLDEHLAFCDLCAQDLADLRGVRKAPRSGRRRWLFAAAAAIAIAAATMLLVSRDDAPDPPDIPRPPAIATVTTTTAVTTASPQTPDYGRADWNAWVGEALASRALPLPPVLRSLRAGRISYRGTTPAGTEMVIVTPYGEVVRSTTPDFAWRAPRGATSVAQVFGPRVAVATSPSLAATRWTSAVPLARGETYTWQVEVTVDGATTILPAPPAPPALFAVLDGAALAEVEKAEEAHRGDPLLLAVVYARHGLQREAIAALETYAAQSRTDTAKALLESVQGWDR